MARPLRYLIQALFIEDGDRRGPRSSRYLDPPICRRQSFLPTSKSQSPTACEIRSTGTQLGEGPGVETHHALEDDNRKSLWELTIRRSRVSASGADHRPGRDPSL